MPSRPRFDAYVLNNNLDRDVFYSLPLALDQAREFESAEVVAERHEIHLRSDVHRGHGHRHALLAVDEIEGVDQTCRLAAVHARREGVDAFALLIVDRGDEGIGQADAVERRARALLNELGVDGDAAPVIRAPLTGLLGRGPLVKAAMYELLALLDDLPALPLARPLTVMPAEFEIEAELLDLVCPSLLPAIRIHAIPATAAETAAIHDGAGGSFHAGAPYVAASDDWPTCPDCGRAMAGCLQVDTRDVGWPAPHGLYTLFLCGGRVGGRRRGARCRHELLRYHASPEPSRRRPGPPEALRFNRDEATILRPGDPCWLLPDAELFVQAHPEQAARLCEVGYDDDPTTVFELVAVAIGVSSLPDTSYFGGHHYTAAPVHTPTPRCGECHEACELLVQFISDKERRCLWACQRHRSQAFHISAP